MKVNGEKIEGTNRIEVFVPRGDDGDGHLFIVEAVKNLDEFNNRCPEPKPPFITRPGKAPAPDFNNPTYLRALETHNKKRLGFFIVWSLKATPGLEWESVTEDNPETWSNYEQELLEAGFTQLEVNYLITKIMAVNTLDEGHIKAARERFLAMKAQADQSAPVQA